MLEVNISLTQRKISEVFAKAIEQIKTIIHPITIKLFAIIGISICFFAE
jgi:hypothetical protein